MIWQNDNSFLLNSCSPITSSAKTNNELKYFILFDLRLSEHQKIILILILIHKNFTFFEWYFNQRTAMVFHLLAITIYYMRWNMGTYFERTEHIFKKAAISLTSKTAYWSWLELFKVILYILAGAVNLLVAKFEGLNA